MKALLVTERWPDAGEIQSHLTKVLNKKVILSPLGLCITLISQGNVNQVIFDERIDKQFIKMLKSLYPELEIGMIGISLNYEEQNAIRWS
ncbi:hypothetical protein KKG58_00140 [Patescibacteria group bacterium]|nr:hypothetical protein [Patescibacteria group bacterium]